MPGMAISSLIVTPCACRWRRPFKVIDFKSRMAFGCARTAFDANMQWNVGDLQPKTAIGVERNRLFDLRKSSTRQQSSRACPSSPTGMHS
ncbi:MAG: hypothetical protein JWN98_49 [Abditibacteriota bacterium]|nr:hypothetical protein [Abditibacteriota bacterium]